MSESATIHGMPGATGVHGSPAAVDSWDRDRWAAHADHLLAAVAPYTSPGGARVTLPGPEGGYGRAIDGLEGFARTFLLGGFRLAGERGDDPHGYAERFAAGLATGTDPASPERWPRLAEHGQAKVEAASIALILDLTRPWIWDRLDAVVQEQVVDYLAEAVGDDTYPRINWVWFRLVVQTFLRGAGGPHALAEMRQDLATHDTFARADGWLADGAERSFDHYNGWALHLYPTLWARMAGAHDLAAERREHDVAQLDRFLGDALALVGGDGSPLVQGRSLAYRFAAAAPFWVGAMAEVPSHSPGRLRHAASAVVGHFAGRGAPDDDGLLTLGWHHAWPRIAQAYSGPGSPYWASKGMLGLALPADHPVWTAPAEPLPVQTGDVLRTVAAPGWIVSGTRADGVVRVVNHGTDHALPGAQGGDSPLYARLGYSTATSPWLDEQSWDSPAEQSVTLLDADGRATHRTGFEVLCGPEVRGHGDSAVAVAASRAAAHWLDPEPGQRDHGSGRRGAATPAGTLTTVSLVRGPWEVRCVQVDDVPDGAAPVTLRVSGWPTVAGDGLDSRLEPLVGDWTAGTLERDGASPLGEHARVPVLDAAVEPGRRLAVLLTLRGTAPDPVPAPDLTAADDPATLTLDGTDAVVRWPDGVTTSTRLD
ncbi:DUF2264 domain-containing protein [Isoptericola sp. S6320L]|uniref:DUF2264 domain-containing protein n=1 Tax=Isoptericola sp. S6320L TaxID=2926411 RepID=UPI001FF26D27|nr:DUF2264 domain-containing protein [Isoptericola sp. S6320L]MCK0117777.1 DUF2264 domain-containing protein [Isoptericola sp. S6320L]